MLYKIERLSRAICCFKSCTVWFVDHIMNYINCQMQNWNMWTFGFDIEWLFGRILISLHSQVLTCVSAHKSNRTRDMENILASPLYNIEQKQSCRLVRSKVSIVQSRKRLYQKWFWNDIKGTMRWFRRIKRQMKFHT